MIRSKINVYYFFALSNFLAAFGGGVILGKGMNVIDISYLKSGSILAFFIGTVIGLVFLQLIPKQFSETIAKWFSFFGSVTSLCLFYIFLNHSMNNHITGNVGILFFALLCTRFGFWFFSRVLRAAAAAGQQQRIAWVELGYYLGVIVGLVIWKFLNFELTMLAALAFDAICQFLAGILDFIANKNNHPPTKIEPILQKSHHSQKFLNNWSWRLAMTVVLLTVAIQVVIFDLAHQVSESVALYVLAFFYLGVSLAAFIYKKFKIELEWRVKNNKYGYAALFINNNTSITFSLILCLALLCVFISVVAINFFKPSTTLEVETYQIILISFIFLAAFFYELLTLALLDRISIEENSPTKSNMIIRTYGMMGISAALSLWFFDFMNNSFLFLSFVLLLCWSFSFFNVQKRGAIGT